MLFHSTFLSVGSVNSVPVQKLIYAAKLGGLPVYSSSSVLCIMSEQSHPGQRSHA